MVFMWFSCCALIYFIVNLQFKRRLAQAETKALRQLDHAKNHLYTNISHEFRTPITVIMGMAEQVKDNPEKWFRQGLEMIIENSQKLLRLVNNMLSLEVKWKQALWKFKYSKVM